VYSTGVPFSSAGSYASSLPPSNPPPSPGSQPNDCLVANVELRGGGREWWPGASPRCRQRDVIWDGTCRVARVTVKYFRCSNRLRRTPLGTLQFYSHFLCGQLFLFLGYSNTECDCRRPKKKNPLKENDCRSAHFVSHRNTIGMVASGHPPARGAPWGTGPVGCPWPVTRTAPPSPRRGLLTRAAVLAPHLPALSLIVDIFTILDIWVSSLQN